MSTSWSQGGQPAGMGGPRRSVNPPPVCFNCGQEGHFVVACSEQSRLNNGSFSFPSAPQYGPPAQYSYSQPPTTQPYSTPSASAQYGRAGYQPPPYSQYPPQNGPPQYGSPGYQYPSHQYGPPVNGPYQPPPNNYPLPNTGYGGSSGSSSAPHQPPPQWSNTPPASRNAPPYQRQQWKISQSYQREISGTQSQYSHLQTTQQEYGFEIRQQTPQTPASNSSNNQALVQGSQGPPIVAPHESNASSRASTPYGRRESGAGLGQTTIKFNPEIANGEKLQELAKPEEETSQAEDPEQRFNWDFKYIFKEPPKPESVALAQPLSTTFDMTPVPQVDPRSTRSVSRYARNDNLKEFVRSIRNAPQWSYLQEDPAFTDASLEGPLIPVEEIPAWMEKRQGITEIADIAVPVESSRKRAWSEEQDDFDNQIALGVVEELEDSGHASKRQRNEGDGELDEHMVDVGKLDNNLSIPTHGTPVLVTLGTPVLGRSGTPCLANVDDAWAPQPGEGAAAASSENPTEALLASLGVTGSPKPVVDEPLPPYVVPVEVQYESQAKGSLQPQIANSSAPVSNATPPNLQQHNRQGPPMNNQYSNEPQNGFRGGPHDGSQPGPHGNQPYALRSASWSNDPPTNAPYGSTPQGSPTQFGPSMNQYQTGPSASVPHGNPHYGPPRSESYPNLQYGPPQYNVPLQNAHYGTQQQYGSLPTQHAQLNGPPQYGNALPPSTQFGPPQYTNPQYNNAQPQAPPQHMNGPQPSYGAPEVAPQYGNIPVNQPQYANTSYASVPPRQDSGYMSARGSYSNESGRNGFNQNLQHIGQYPPNHNQQGNHPYNSQQPSEDGQSEGRLRQNSTPGEPGTPLSPTSAEILGKLVRKPSSARKSELSRQSDETGTRKTRRPQPVVAEAYSRRW